MELQPREVLIYRTSNGHEPFSEWMNKLTMENRTIILNRLDRVEKGNFGDVKSLGDRVFELRFHHRSGFRIYYGLEGSKVVLLLLGGDKDTQTKDIKLAKKYWNEYKESTT